MAEIQFYNSDWEVSEALQAFYTPYASYVIQTRALPDARDGLKTGARFILYAQYLDKLTYKNKRRKAVATVNAAMRFSPHGDSSILGTAVRMSQDFSLRYPVIEVQGNNGSYLAGDDYSQARYLEMRGNEIAYDMTSLLEKETVDKWKMNYTNEEKYPTVLPNKFPYGLVNGSYGIGVACASSIPPHNIVDVCNAAIVLLENPEASFEEIYCPIDFPTGGTIINEKDVKESLKNGNGKAALIRASIDYDEKENELVVYEMPYMTFTGNTVAAISKAIDEGLLLGVESVIDGTDYNGPKIYIKLSKHANVKKVIRLLYKHTPLQNSFAINVNMLEDGLRPKCYTWKEHLNTYLTHLRTIIVKAYTYDLNKLKARIHILEGLILAVVNIDEVVKVIRSSESTSTAKSKLMEKYVLDEVQSDAILKMKLSSLTHLKVEKLEKEKTEKEFEAGKIEAILSNEENIKAEMIKDIKNIQNKYGDERKTKNISLDFTSEEEDAEPIEKKELLIYYTNFGNLYTFESSTLVRTRRGGKGSKIKLSNGEVITKTIRDDNFSSLLVFTNKGEMYSLAVDELPVGSKINVNQLFEFKSGEVPTSITTYNKADECKHFIFVTKNGMIKKTLASEYKMRRGKVIKAINLRESDEVQSVHFANEEQLGILTNNGNFVIINTDDIKAIGRTSMGIRGIKLSDDDYVIDSHLVKETDKYLISISKDGIIKKVNLSEFSICNRNIKGKRISEIKDGDKVLKYLTIGEDCDIIIVSKKKSIKISTSELRVLRRAAIGVKSSTLDENDIIVDLQKEQW